MIQFVEKAEGLIFNVRVIQKSSNSEVVGEHDGALKIKLKAPPVDGAANEELVRVLAKAFDVPACQVEITNGHKSKTKTVRVSGVRSADFERLMESR